jgi:hypothetical protein
VTLSFVDERQFLIVIQLVPAPAESTAAKSPPPDPAPVDPAPAESPPSNPAPTKSSAEPLHSAVGDALTETS